MWSQWHVLLQLFKSILFPSQEVNDTVLVRWPQGKVGPENAPPDIPVCGFEGEHCTEGYMIVVIVCSFHI